MEEDLDNDDSITDLNSLQERSRKIYEAAYKSFVDWCSTKNEETYTEEVLLEYFHELSYTYCAASLWKYYSMLRSTLRIYNNVNIEFYHKLRAFIKAKAKGYKSKKAKVFTQEEIDTFVCEAPDDIYLATKVAVIFGMMGGCRTYELHSLTLDQMEDFGTALLVTIPSANAKRPRQFTITGIYYEFCRMYMNLRPENALSKSFFLNYQKGKCTVQNIGINKFGMMGKQVAKFLNLPEPDMYTGTSFRRQKKTR